MAPRAPKTTLSFQASPPSTVEWGTYETPFYALVIGLTEDGSVCRVSFMVDKNPRPVIAAWQSEWQTTSFEANPKKVGERAQKIFQHGEAVKLVMEGTDFQKAVWSQLFSIRSGRTLSYGELAKRIGKPKAVRAVGSACGANPIAILVPCHRVLARKGKLGGFAGGLNVKRALLAAEGIALSQRAA